MAACCSQALAPAATGVAGGRERAAGVRGCGWVAKRWSVEGTRWCRGGRVGGLYDGIDFYVCEKYKMMDINLPRLAAILSRLLPLCLLHPCALSLRPSRSLALSPKLSPSYTPSWIGRTQFTRCTATLISTGVHLRARIQGGSFVAHADGKIAGLWVCRITYERSLKR